jgi:IclR family transcriptional regulator, pca regulon regulatory protein
LTGGARADYARRPAMAGTSNQLRDADFVRSIERGLAVIAALGHPGGGMTLADVARAIGVTRASARRTLLTLEQLGYLRCDGRLFTLTPKVLDLGHGYRSGIALPDVARPHLQQLMEATDEFCSVSVLDGDETLCVARVAPARIMNVAMPVGTRLPAYATCVGRVLLAALNADELDRYFERVELRPLTPATRASVPALRDELDRVRRQRYAVVDQELERGLRSAAAPIRDIAGRVIAAANLGALAGRVTVATLRRDLVPRLRAAAESIEHDLAVARA